MNGFTKLFSDIVDSSIWDEDSDTCKVWVTLLALADWNGYVRGSIGWLAGKSRVSLEASEKAISKFKSPDPRSRTPDNDGRRVEQLEDGWLVLNYIAFRDRLSSDPKAVASRDRVRKHRECYRALRNAKSVTSDHAVSVSASVRTGDRGVGEEGNPEIRFTKPSMEELIERAKAIGLPEDQCGAFMDYYDSCGWRVGKKPMASWRGALGNWLRNWKNGVFRNPSNSSSQGRMMIL